jgi:transposase InsO family protein
LREPGDWAVLNQLFDPGHEMVQLAESVDAELSSFQGASGFENWKAQLEKAGDARAEIVALTAVAPGRVAVQTRSFMRGERGGADVERTIANVVHLEGGRITRTPPSQRRRRARGSHLAAWLYWYNHLRPHGSLGRHPPQLTSAS